MIVQKVMIPIKSLRLYLHLIHPLLSTTVLPYLENLHFPSPQTSRVASEPDLEPSQDPDQELKVDTETERPSSAPQTGFENRLVRKKSKTTSCIKLKNGCKTQ